MEEKNKPWYQKPLKELNRDEKRKAFRFAFVVVIIGFFIFYFLFTKIGGSEKKYYDNPTCCNCWGTGKITAFGTTVNCPYCYGTGHLSQATYEKKCK